MEDQVGALPCWFLSGQGAQRSPIRGGVARPSRRDERTRCGRGGRGADAQAGTTRHLADDHSVAGWPKGLTPGRHGIRFHVFRYHPRLPGVGLFGRRSRGPALRLPPPWWGRRAQAALDLQSRHGGRPAQRVGQGPPVMQTADQAGLKAVAGAGRVGRVHGRGPDGVGSAIALQGQQLVFAVGDDD
jgi:hypothetical protein